MSYSRRRKLPWHQRPRAWFRGWLYHILDREEEQPLTDDHGNHIGEMLPPVRRWPQPADDRPVIRTAEVGGVYLPLSGDPNPWAPCQFRQDVRREVMPRGQCSAEPLLVRDVSRPAELQVRGGAPVRPLPDPPAAPGHLTAFAGEVMPDSPRWNAQGRSRSPENVPRPGDSTNPRCHSEQHAAGPGHLTLFASPFGAPGRIPATPRPPREPVVWWRPRECGGRITALAGA